MNNDLMIQEIYRKLIHITSIWIVILYYFIDKISMIMVLGFVTSVFFSFDFLRSKSKFLEKIFQYFHYIMRDFEKIPGKLTGASYFLISSFLVICFSDKMTAMIAISVLVIADSFAAIIGKIYGKTKLYDKTLEGSTAFFVSGIITGFVVLYLFHQKPAFYISHITVMLFATYIELISSKIKIDDNFLIPLIIAISMYLIKVIV